jgi:hypothetical protein
MARSSEDDSGDVPVVELPSTYLPETDESTPYVILDTQAKMVIVHGDGGGEVRMNIPASQCSFDSLAHAIR